MIKTYKEDKELILEANRIDYMLYSTFFYRKLKELECFRIIKDVEEIVKQSYNYSWEDKKSWNITFNAWDTIKKENINCLRVFAHPKILVEHPPLIHYYRIVASIQLKGLHYLAHNVSDYENWKKNEIKYPQALALAKLFNSHISMIIESALTIDTNVIKSLIFSSASAIINGLWKNKIGEEAETMVKSYIIRLCLNENLIDSMIDRERSPELFDDNVDYVANILEYKGTKLKNQKSILFANEPDISFIDRSGKSIAVIEVKGGTDPEGALERLGAIKKSFDQARRDNPDVKRILLVSCITGEMRARLDDEVCDSFFNLTSIINDMDKRQEFLEKIKEIIAME